MHGVIPRTVRAWRNQLARREPKPGREMSCGLELSAIPHGRDNRRRRDGADPWRGGQSLAGFAGFVPGDDPLLDLMDAQTLVIDLIE